jgi:hypothetical protein
MTEQLPLSQGESRLPIPDHEARCNAFVAAVTEKVVPKYSNELDVFAVNETSMSKDMPAITEELTRRFSEIIPANEIEEHRREALSNSLNVDIESIFFSKAVVVIEPKREGVAEQISQTVAEIKEIAAEYQADRVEQSEEPLSEDEKPSVFLDVFFEKK